MNFPIEDKMIYRAAQENPKKRLEAIEYYKRVVRLGNYNKDTSQVKRGRKMLAIINKITF